MSRPTTHESFASLRQVYAPRLRGPVETYFHTLTRPRRDCARVPLSARCLLLFHRRLHGDMHACRAHVPVKTACESEQTQSVQRYMRRKNSDSFLTREAVGVKTLSQDPTLLARNGIKRAMYRGRYGIDASSHTAPQPHPRARHKVPARRRRSGRICVRRV